MSVSIQLRTERDARKLKGKVRNARAQLNAFRISTLTDIGNRLVIPEIKKRMRAEKYPQRVIDNTFLAGVEIQERKYRLLIKSEFILESGFDLAAGFEFGTKASPGRFVPAIEARLIDPSHPSFGIHPGTKAHHIIEDTTDELKPKVQEEYKQRERTWLNQNFR